MHNFVILLHKVSHINSQARWDREFAIVSVLFSTDGDQENFVSRAAKLTETIMIEDVFYPLTVIHERDLGWQKREDIFVETFENAEKRRSIEQQVKLYSEAKEKLSIYAGSLEPSQHSPLHLSRSLYLQVPFRRIKEFPEPPPMSALTKIHSSLLLFSRFLACQFSVAPLSPSLPYNPPISGTEQILVHDPQVLVRPVTKRTLYSRLPLSSSSRWSRIFSMKCSSFGSPASASLFNLIAHAHFPSNITPADCLYQKPSMVCGADALPVAQFQDFFFPCPTKLGPDLPHLTSFPTKRVSMTHNTCLQPSHRSENTVDDGREATINDKDKT